MKVVLKSRDLLSFFLNAPTFWWILVLALGWLLSYQVSGIVAALTTKVISFFSRTYSEQWELILISPATALLLLMLEYLWLGWHRSSLRSLLNPTRNEWNDIVAFLVAASQIHAIVGFAMSLGLAVLIPGYVRDMIHLNMLHGVESLFLQHLLFLLLVDFVDYWLHRAQHSWRVLWHSHHFHHSATNFDMINSKRNHPLEVVSIKRILFTIPFAVIGVPIETLLGYHVFVQINTFLSHSKFNMHYGLVGRFLLVSPNYHKIHHARDTTLANRNYGGLLVVWDRLFGTYHAPDRLVTDFGVEGSNHNRHDYLKILVHDYLLFWRDLLAVFQRRAQ